jgi:hypothetical protein
LIPEDKSEKANPPWKLLLYKLRRTTGKPERYCRVRRGIQNGQTNCVEVFPYW